MERADGILFMESHAKSLVTSGLLLVLLERTAQQCCILNCDSSFPPKNTEHPWLKMLIRLQMCHSGRLFGPV